MNEERILLGGWLLGYNLDDMNQFESTDFIHYGQIFRLLKEGNNALDITRKMNISIVELAKMQQEYSGLFYSQIFEQWQKDKILRQIAQVDKSADVEAIKDRIDYLLESRETVKDNTGWANLFTQEMTRRASEKTIRYGLPTLDRMTGGLRRKELTTVAARPSVGKSAFGLQIAMKVWSAGQKVLYFPLEMSTVQTLSRIVISNELADTWKIKSGKLSDNEMMFAQDMVAEIEKSRRFKIYEGQGNIETILTAIKREKPFLVVVDQLTQMTAPKRFQSVRERFSYMTNTLKKIAMEQDVAVMMLCQINRNAQNTTPTMADLKESGSIEEDSDNIIMLHRLDPSKADDPSAWINEQPMRIMLEKQRDGETGEFIAAFNSRRFTFYERI